MIIMRITIGMLSLLILAACAATPVKESGVTEIKPCGHSRRVCFHASRTGVLSMRLKLSERVDFNIHYHADQKIFYPVEKPGIASDSGKYEPLTEDIYCLMWTNTNKFPVSVNYRYEIHDEVKPIMPPPPTRPGNVY